MYTFYTMNPSASTAACITLIGQMLTFLAIATTGTPMGHQRFCVRMIAIVRTFSKRTG
jgi:hypothetical protein